MKAAIRVAGALVAALATFYFVYWVPFSLILPTGRWIPLAGSLICALAVTRYTWRHTAPLSGGLAESGSVTPPRVAPTGPRWVGRRVVAAVVGVLVLRYAIWWTGSFMVGGSPAVSVPLGLGAVLAGYLWWFALRGHRPDSRGAMAFGCRGGAIGGAIGFVLGFVGPIIFAPGANQGPLLGIFITGPAGVVLGTLGATVICAVRRRQAEGVLILGGLMALAIALAVTTRGSVESRPSKSRFWGIMALAPPPPMHDTATEQCRITGGIRDLQGILDSLTVEDEMSFERVHEGHGRSDSMARSTLTLVRFGGGDSVELRIAGPVHVTLGGMVTSADEANGRWRCTDRLPGGPDSTLIVDGEWVLRRGAWPTNDLAWPSAVGRRLPPSDSVRRSSVPR